MNEIDKNKQNNNSNNKIVTHMCMVSPTFAEKTQARQVPLKSVSYLLTNFSLRDLGYPENSVVRRNLTGFWFTANNYVFGDNPTLIKLDNKMELPLKVSCC